MFKIVAQELYIIHAPSWHRKEMKTLKIFSIYPTSAQIKEINYQPKQKLKSLTHHEVFLSDFSNSGTILVKLFHEKYSSTKTLPRNKILFTQPFKKPEMRLPNNYS